MSQHNHTPTTFLFLLICLSRDEFNLFILFFIMATFMGKKLQVEKSQILEYLQNK